jgi:coenzyme F420-reducing hydrogenase beta subunit
MKCIGCGTSVMQLMLHRTNETGQDDPGWMCENCIQSTHPELYKNIMEDKKDDPILDVLSNICYKQK